MGNMERNLPTVYIYNQSFDIAEPYLVTCLDSIKNQTYKNFICYIYDNGSGKAVRDIIYSYAANDSRFRVILCEKTNTSIAWKHGIPQIIHDSHGQGYFTRIDGDDALELDALAKMVAYAEKHSLDMTVAGAHFIDGKSGKLVGDRCLQKNIVVEAEQYGEVFCETYQLMRTHWLKLYKMDVIKAVNTANFEPLPYGSDTVWVRQTILHSNRIGVLSDCLYRYNSYGGNNKTYNMKPERLHAPEKLFQNDTIFLTRKCGYVSKRNFIFLLGVLLGETGDSFNLIRQGVYGDNYIDLIHSVVCTKWVANAVHVVGNKHVCPEIVNWLLGKDIFVDEETLKKAAEILAVCALYPERLPASDVAKELLLLLYVYHFWDYADSKDALEKVIASKLQEIPLLKSATVFFAVNCSDLLYFILTKDYADAIQWIVAKLEKNEQAYMDNWELDLIRLGFNLAALLEDGERFVWFKEKEIAYLLRYDKIAAAKEIEEWKDIFPGGFWGT